MRFQDGHFGRLSGQDISCQLLHCSTSLFAAVQNHAWLLLLMQQNTGYPADQGCFRQVPLRMSGYQYATSTLRLPPISCCE